MRSAPARKKQARAVSTKSALIGAGRRTFGKNGFHATGTADLVAEASVSRGALYHHFKDKTELFAEVVNCVLQDHHRKTMAIATLKEGDLWAMFMQGIETRLELLSTDAEATQIVLIDGPAVLGWRRWQAIHSDTILPGLVQGLTLLMETGTIRSIQAGAMARLIIAVLNDVALAVAHADDRHHARLEAIEALKELLQGLRLGRSGGPAS